MRSNENTNIAIIGAGIVGLCTAYSLRQAGYRVTLYDFNLPGSQCSSGNAGALSSRSIAPLAMPGVLKDSISMLLDSSSPLYVPTHYWLKAAPWFLRFIAAARPERVAQIASALDRLLAGSVEAHAQLAKAIGRPDLVRASGQLHLYPNEPAYLKDLGSWDLKTRHGLRAERVDRKGILELEPEMGPDYTTGVFLPDEGWVGEPLVYAQAIAQSLQNMGVAFQTARIANLSQENQKWTLSDRTSHWQADRVVVCAGAWSRPLLAAQGHDVPLESQRGYHLQIPDPKVHLQRVVVLADRKVFMTPMDSGLRIAGTVEFGGNDSPPNQQRAMLLAEHARAGFPTLSIRSPASWMGSRPCLPDSMPVIGPIPDRPGLWCAFGHGHLGLTGSVNTGQLIARSMAGQATNDELAPFSIQRFR
jgi:glycine/D-amino acid oxidase-like deaminating enzyme